jgi:hypothetical protein
LGGYSSRWAALIVIGKSTAKQYFTLIGVWKIERFQSRSEFGFLAYGTVGIRAGKPDQEGSP